MEVTAHADVAAALRPWLAERLRTSEVTIRGLRRHTEGWSWRTYTFDAAWRDSSDGVTRRQGFAVRAEPPDGLLAPYDIRGQYALHQVVRRHPDVPTPQLYWLELDSRVLGMPFYVMERVRGAVPVQWRGNDPAFFPTPRARHRIGLQFVDIQSAIHAVDWRGEGLTFLGEPADGEDAAARQVEHWARYFEDSVLVDIPVVRFAIGWLRSNLASSGRLALCHGDYRIGNFMLRAGRIVAVFDWELAHVSDPVEDIAYSGLPLFRGRNPMLSQLLLPEEYFRRYRERTGLRVDGDVFRFWTVLGLVKATASHVRATRAYEDGRAGDLRLAAMGHQVEYLVRHLANSLALRRTA